MEDLDSGTSESIGRGSVKMRTRKKSTLAKLKEKKLREQGSLTSLQSACETQEEKSSVNGSPQALQNIHLKNLTSAGISENDRIFSTKDSPETDTSTNDAKPKPRPRGRRQSSDSRSARSKSEDQDVDADLNLGLQEKLRDLKMSGPYGEGVDPAISNSGFIPKPPVTPRSQNSNPRTPRNLVPASKGEKRTREHRSSGEEAEIEEKKEKNSEGDLKTVKSLSSNLHPQLENKALLSHKPTERLLKRRSSKDSAAEAKTVVTELASQASNGIGKPPVYNPHSHHNTNNNSNHSHGSDLPYPAGIDSALHQSPRGKYLKSATKSHTDNSAQLPGGAGKTKIHLTPETPEPSDLPLSSQLEPSTIPGAKHSLSLGSSGLTDVDIENKSSGMVSSWTSPPLTSPPSPGRLDPISPRPNPPPPLEGNFSSQSLRTSFRVDPNVRPSTGSGGRGRTGTISSTSGGRGGMGQGEKSDSCGATSNGDRVSQQSFASGSVLPVITTKEARSRSYLEGSIRSGSPSMSGSDELDRYFPARKVNVLVGTWNMNEQKEINYPLDDFVLPMSCDYIQDIYAFGTQENDMNKKEWEIKIQETIGPSHVMFQSVSLGSLHLVVFIRRDLIWFCSSPEEDVLSLRAVTMVRTKGAIGISFSLFGTSYLFINCHLTSDRDNDNTRKKNRLGDYFKVIQDMKLPRSSQLLSSSKKTSDITAIFDCVFWCGDLNFRIERKRHAVEGKLSQFSDEEFPNFETLLGGDQLIKYMTEGKIFHGFQEGRIKFNPTFKFDVNKDTYDSSQKNRVPSYTDRIMFRSKRKNDITCMCYDAVMSIKHSDHKPVYGQFETVVRAGSDNVVYSAGHFDRAVYMEANRRRAAKSPKKKSNSKVCAVQ
ncbi:72 kDa inositol polyphosphate 5-phosphatase [Elysia marginata]|uniref:72 kDa inositol polyphosphate 5-phosphatase n=1 Tax=Elysia marginata TaxID=1093978 RepID=A0AAV4GFP0_9GAST|nr:72 kDa inositol polyphosphate 5-phosphatase [Elysia marginata]